MEKSEAEIANDEGVDEVWVGDYPIVVYASINYPVCGSCKMQVAEVWNDDVTCEACNPTDQTKYSDKETRVFFNDALSARHGLLCGEVYELIGDKWTQMFPSNSP